MAGRIGIEQIDLLAKAHSQRVAGAHFAEFVTRLIDDAEHVEYDDFDTIVTHFIQRSDPDGSFDDQQFRESQHHANVTVTNGAVEVHASGARRSLPLRCGRSFEPRSKQSSTKTVQRDVANTVRENAKRPEPLVSIVIDHATAGRVVHSHGLTESADILGVTIDLGRTQRLFTGKARDAAQLLAVSCAHAGCDIPARLCDLDHRAEWPGDDGPTDQANAMPLCGVHDRWKHRHRIRSRRATNGRIYLIRPDGSVIQPVGETEPDWAEPPPGNTNAQAA